MGFGSNRLQQHEADVQRATSLTRSRGVLLTQADFMQLSYGGNGQYVFKAMCILSLTKAVNRQNEEYKQLLQQPASINTVHLQAANMAFFKQMLGLLVLLVVFDRSWAEEKVRIRVLSVFELTFSEG